MNTLGKGEAHRAAVRAFLAGHGWITEDCHWINTTTGEIGSQARWLLSAEDAVGDPRPDSRDDEGEADA